MNRTRRERRTDQILSDTHRIFFEHLGGVAFTDMDYSLSGLGAFIVFEHHQPEAGCRHHHTLGRNGEGMGQESRFAITIESLGRLYIQYNPKSDYKGR